MKRYIYLDENKRAREILTEYTKDFPNIPIRERYAKSFLDNCVEIENVDMIIKQGMLYLEETKEFIEYIEPEIEEVVEENVGEVVEENVGEVVEE